MSAVKTDKCASAPLFPRDRTNHRRENVRLRWSWSPALCYPLSWRALRRRANADSGLLSQAGDYATFKFQPHPRRHLLGFGEWRRLLSKTAPSKGASRSLRAASAWRRAERRPMRPRLPRMAEMVSHLCGRCRTGLTCSPAATLARQSRSIAVIRRAVRRQRPIAGSLGSLRGPDPLPCA